MGEGMERKEFRCVVLGDEPASLWLLERLATLSAQRGEPISLAWISLGRAEQRLCVPNGFGERFSLPIGQPWSSEVLCRDLPFSWDPVTIRERYPALPFADSEKEWFDMLVQPNEKIRKACRTAIESDSSLLNIAKAIWKRVGRTFRLAPEQFLIGALLCRRMSWWTPEAVGFEGERFRIDPRTNPIENLHFERDGAMTLTFEGLPPIVGYEWILGSNIHDLELLCRKQPQLLDIAFPAADFEAHSHSSLYPLHVKVASCAVSVAMRPLTLSFETDQFPEIDSELWPIDAALGLELETQRELVVWASAFQGLDLDNVLAQFRRGFAHLSKLLPYVPDRVAELSVPLDMNTCASDTLRDRVMNQLEAERIERYDLTRFHTQTRSKNVHALFPNLFCHLPYPVGPFIAAEQMLALLLGKPKTRKFLDPPRSSTKQKTDSLSV